VPLYEYECATDGRFELIRKFSDPPLSSCPTCGSPVEKQASAPAIQFKGSGWYITDYARKPSGEGASKDKGDGPSKDKGEGAGKDKGEGASKDKGDGSSSEKASSKDSSSTSSSTPSSTTSSSSGSGESKS